MLVDPRVSGTYSAHAVRPSRIDRGAGSFVRSRRRRFSYPEQGPQVVLLAIPPRVGPLRRIRGRKHIPQHTFRLAPIESQRAHLW